MEVENQSAAERVAHLAPEPRRGSSAWLPVIALLLAAQTAAAFLPYVKAANPLTRDRWEYTIKSFSDLNLEWELEKVGDEGWQVLSSRRASSNSAPCYEFVMGRKK